jgi:hypothetical protein
MNLQLIVLSLLGCTFTQIHIRQIKYLNNIVEQDHLGILQEKRKIATQPYFKPGMAWHYSNTNYVLDGMIIQTATGKSVEEEMGTISEKPNLL